MDKILGLEYGADDYVTKPFNILKLKHASKPLCEEAAYYDSSAAAPETVQILSLVICVLMFRAAACLF